MDILIAKWTVKGGKRFIELYRDEKGYYFYRGENCGGNLGTAITTDEMAKTYMVSLSGPVTVLAFDFPSVKLVYD